MKVQRRVISPFVHWGITGCLLVLLLGLLSWLSQFFDQALAINDGVIWELVSLKVLAGLVFVYAVWKLESEEYSVGLFTWIVVIGLILRAIMFVSTPMLEDDFYRYLWDGAVTANGINPFQYTPAQIIDNDQIPDELRALADQSDLILVKVNHPQLATIYPPVAQAAFAVAYWITPWSLTTWRIVLALFDLATFALLVAILRLLNQSVILGVVYLWNPIVILETLNTAHMDVLALPFVFAAILLTIQKRVFWAVLALSLGVGVKLWPIILLPVLLRMVFPDFRKLTLLLMTFFLATGIWLFPHFQFSFGEASGTLAYSKQWEMNDALFMLFLWCIQWLFQWTSVSLAHFQLATRLLAGSILLGGVWAISVKPHSGWESLCRKCMLLVALAFLLSPTQFPWYSIWVISFLVISPMKPLLILPVVLPMYYLRFYFSNHQEVELFDYGIVWIEYLPVWILLLLNRRAITFQEATSPGDAGILPATQ